MNQHFMEIFGSVLVALITALFGPVAILWVKKKLTKPKDELEIELYSTEKITTEIEEVLKKLDADRVWITQFHNGGHFLHSNKSMQKFSVVYEVDAAGVLPVSTIFTNIPISLYSRCFSEMLTTKFIAIRIIMFEFFFYSVHTGHTLDNTSSIVTTCLPRIYLSFSFSLK